MAEPTHPQAAPRSNLQALGRARAAPGLVPEVGSKEARGGQDDASAALHCECHEDPGQCEALAGPEDSSIGSCLPPGK